MGSHLRHCDKNPKNGEQHAIVSTRSTNRSEELVSKKDFIHAYELKVAYTTGDVVRLLRGYAESIGVPFPTFAARVAEGILRQFGRGAIGGSE